MCVAPTFREAVEHGDDPAWEILYCLCVYPPITQHHSNHTHNIQLLTLSKTHFRKIRSIYTMYVVLTGLLVGELVWSVVVVVWTGDHSP